MPNDPAALARAVADAMWAEDRASNALGMRIEEVGPGRAVLSMVVTDRMVNGHAICHGGFIFALADSAMAVASNSHGERVITQHCAVTFLRPGRLGETLRAEAAERTRAPRSGIYDVRVTGAEADTVAEFRGHTRTIPGAFFPSEPSKAP